MTLKKQANSSTESSSGSSSDSSSSGSSSSSSGSGSSTSDTETTTSEESPRAQGEAASSVAAAASAPTVPTDPPAERSATRRSADAPPAKIATASNKQQDKSTNGKTKTDKPTPAKVETKNKKQSVSSSEDDAQSKSADPKPAPPRRRSSAQTKPKNSATVTTRPSRPANRPSGTRPPTRPPPAKLTGSAKGEVKKPLKKKSIFSPDNSSESDHDDDSKSTKPAADSTPQPSPSRKAEHPRPLCLLTNKKSDAPPEKSKEPESSSKQKRASAPNVPPAVKKKPEKNVKYQSKAFVSSCSSTDSESTGSTSSSDNESNAGSRKNVTAPKRAAIITAKLARSKGSKPDPVKTDKNTPTKEPTAAATTTTAAAAAPGTDSDVENTKPASNANAVNVTRKLTRSTSARKSRHVVGRVVNSDSDSDPEAGPAKRSASKSPVKRATVSSKGPPALMCPVKGRGGIGPILERRIANTSPSSITSQSATDKHQEPRCPLPGCDSVGHLSGRLEKHFTIEACPIYHNTTAEECKKRVAIVRALQETRRKSQHALASRRTTQPSLEHRNYQLKVKEMRSKWKPPQSSSSGDANQDGAAASAAPITDAERSGEREPRLEGFVSNYDLNLFREAQAAAAYKIEEELKNMPPSKGTRFVCMGKYCMEAWYQSPYPADAARLPQLYLCEFCLNHHKTATGITRHRAKCVWRHPPGDEVYRKGRLGVWQVDGRKHKQYCQQLCLLAKFFLDHKTLYYDVEPFLFYVMTLADSEGCHTVGYFSKEKNSLLNYNVSCILTLPPYQRQGYGRLLIDFSYLLTRVEGKIGSPEKPLSDLGLISYRSYWKDVLLQHLCAHPGASLSIRDLSQEMAINSYDIVSTLQALGMMKYWKGKHIILKRKDVLDEYMERVKRRGRVKQIDPSCLRWTPFVPPSAQGGS